jgi:hypothetical protein
VKLKEKKYFKKHLWMLKVAVAGRRIRRKQIRPEF